MSDIYTGIDLGTDSVKVVVCEKINDKYHVLASSSYPSSGIKDGFITDNRMAINSVSNAIRQVNEMLGIKITKVIACVPPANCSMDIVVGKVDVIDYNEITGIDIFSGVYVFVIVNPFVISPVVSDVYPCGIPVSDIV